jgi:hypothetical protein
VRLQSEVTKLRLQIERAAEVKAKEKVKINREIEQASKQTKRKLSKQKGN